MAIDGAPGISSPRSTVAQTGTVSESEALRGVNVVVNNDDKRKKRRKMVGCLPLRLRSRKGHVVVAPPTELPQHVSKNGDAVINVPASIIPSESKVVKRKDFPTHFIFGCSTSAFQTEGAGTEGGRGASTWDGFIQDEIAGPDLAVDSYHRYKEDVQLLKNMGADS